MKRTATGFVEQHEGEARRAAPLHRAAPAQPPRSSAHPPSQTPCAHSLTPPCAPLHPPHTPSHTLTHSHTLSLPSQARTHYSWLPTRAYREAFGLLTYRDALPAFQPACAFGNRSVCVQRLSGARVWVPAHLVQSGSCYVTVRHRPRNLQPSAIQSGSVATCTGRLTPCGSVATCTGCFDPMRIPTLWPCVCVCRRRATAVRRSTTTITTLTLTLTLTRRRATAVQRATRSTTTTTRPLYRQVSKSVS